MKIKALLYCCKSMPILSEVEYLYGDEIKTKYQCIPNTKKGNEYLEQMGLGEFLNGKIVIECDFEVEEIFRDFIDGKDYTINPDGVWVKSYYFKTKTLYANELYNKSCLTFEQIYKYFYDKDDKLVGYAINVNNLHIFDEPRELAYSTYDNDSYYYTKKYDNLYKTIRIGALITAPKNISKVYDKNGNEYLFISVSPQEMCRIANKEQTVLVRKNVLKETLKNE